MAKKVSKKKSKNGTMLAISPFDYWKIQRDYNSQLSKQELKYLNDFDNEFICGWFLKDRKLIHADPVFIKNRLEEFKRSPELYAEFLKDKENWQKRSKRKVSDETYVLQRIKQEAWNDKTKRREDIAALNYKGQEDNGDFKEDIHSHDSRDISQFQVEFLKAYKENKVLEFLMEWFDYALDIEEMEIGSYYAFAVGQWWEQVKADYLNHTIRATFFRTLFARIVRFSMEKCESKNEVYLIYKDIDKVFTNFYENKEQVSKGNVYGH